MGKEEMKAVLRELLAELRKEGDSSDATVDAIRQLQQPGLRPEAIDKVMAEDNPTKLNDGTTMSDDVF